MVTGRQDSILFNPNNEGAKYAMEAAVYIQDDWEIGEKLKINYGIRWSSFNQVGPCLLYTSDAADERSSVDLGGRRIIKKKKKT